MKARFCSFGFSPLSPSTALAAASRFCRALSYYDEQVPRSLLAMDEARTHVSFTGALAFSLRTERTQQLPF